VISLGMSAEAESGSRCPARRLRSSVSCRRRIVGVVPTIARWLGSYRTPSSAESGVRSRTFPCARRIDCSGSRTIDRDERENSISIGDGCDLKFEFAFCRQSLQDASHNPRGLTVSLFILFRMRSGNAPIQGLPVLWDTATCPLNSQKNAPRRACTVGSIETGRMCEPRLVHGGPISRQERCVCTPAGPRGR
jgi:hypothetical protein